MTEEEYQELLKYANLDGSEIGDYVSHLVYTRGFNEDHGMTKEFSASLNKESMYWLNKFKSETYILEVTESVPDRIVSELVWKD